MVFFRLMAHSSLGHFVGVSVSAIVSADGVTVSTLLCCDEQFQGPETFWEP